MANLQQVSKLLENVTCPICMEILQNPVTIDCGHNFCLQCINQVGETAENLQCPLCKLPVDKNAFRPDQLLASIAENIQAMIPAEFQPEEGPRCWKHKEKYYYFCEKDKEFLHLVCHDSKDHKTHEVTLIDEAAQNYKVQIETQLWDLGQMEKKIIKEKKEGEGAIQVFRAQVHLEKLKVLEEFKNVRQRLEEEERFLLSRLSWLEQEGVKQIEEYVTDTEGQLTTLRELTRSLKNRLQAPSMELLEGINDILGRSREFEFHNPTPVPINLEKKISEAKARHDSIIESLKKLTDNLTAEGKEDKSTFLNSLDKKDMKNLPMTLDSTSADPNLTFSQDLKKASLYVVDGKSNTQAKPRQLYPFLCVRGSPGLSSGRGLWEVEIQGPPGMLGIVGVVAELPQGSQIQNSEPSCLWALRISSSACQPITNCSIQENLPICLRKVGVYVDYDRGDVVFYDAITNKHIYTFQTSFNKQVFPLFGLQTAPQLYHPEPLGLHPCGSLSLFPTHPSRLNASGRNEAWPYSGILHTSYTSYTPYTHYKHYIPNTHYTPHTHSTLHTPYTHYMHYKHYTPYTHYTPHIPNIPYTHYTPYTLYTYYTNYTHTTLHTPYTLLIPYKPHTPYIPYSPYTNTHTTHTTHPTCTSFLE